MIWRSKDAVEALEVICPCEAHAAIAAAVVMTIGVRSRKTRRHTRLKNGWSCSRRGSWLARHTRS